MTVISVNSISGITSITAQSGSLNFYDTTGNTLAIGASVSGNITGNVTGNVNSSGVSTFSNVRVTGGTISGVSTAGITTAYIGAINDGPISGARNRIINGDMRIDQRNAGASITLSGDPQYTLDRWYGSKGGAIPNFTVIRSGSVPSNVGFTNSFAVTMGSGTSPGSTGYAVIAQRIEGYNVADLNLGTSSSKAFTLSFWVNCSVSGTFGISFRNAGVFNATYCSTYTINSTNTWEYKTVTVPAGAINSGTWLTDNTGGIEPMWDLGVGTLYSGTAGQMNTGANYFGVTGTTKLSSTTGATFYLTGVQLEAGTVATPFERRSYGQELALCQRYYCKNSNSDVVATAGTNYLAAGMFSSGIVNAYAANAGYSSWTSFPVTMRTTPSTITFIPSSLGGSSSGQWSIYNSSSSAWTFGNMTVQSSTANGFGAGMGGTWSAGAILMYGAWTASAEL